MNIISCNNCGVVLDADILPFFSEGNLTREDGSINTDRAAWDGQDFVPVAPCPNCERLVTREGALL